MAFLSQRIRLALGFTGVVLLTTQIFAEEMSRPSSERPASSAQMPITKWVVEALSHPNESLFLRQLALESKVLATEVPNPHVEANTEYQGKTNLGLYQQLAGVTFLRIQAWSEALSHYPQAQRLLAVPLNRLKHAFSEASGDHPEFYILTYQAIQRELRLLSEHVEAILPLHDHKLVNEELEIATLLRLIDENPNEIHDGIRALVERALEEKRLVEADQKKERETLATLEQQAKQMGAIYAQLQAALVQLEIRRSNRQAELKQIEARVANELALIKQQHTEQMEAFQAETERLLLARDAQFRDLEAKWSQRQAELRANHDILVAATRQIYSSFAILKSGQRSVTVHVSKSFRAPGHEGDAQVLQAQLENFIHHRLDHVDRELGSDILTSPNVTVAVHLTDVEVGTSWRNRHLRVQLNVMMTVSYADAKRTEQVNYSVPLAPSKWNPRDHKPLLEIIDSRVKHSMRVIGNLHVAAHVGEVQQACAQILAQAQDQTSLSQRVLTSP